MDGRDAGAEGLPEWVRAVPGLVEHALAGASTGFYQQDYVHSRVRWSPELYVIFGVPPDTTPRPDTFLSAIHPEDQPALMVIASKAHDPASSQSSYTAAFRIRRPDGEVRFVEAIGFLERDAHGRVEREHGITRDITELHRRVARSQDSERLEMVGRLSTGVAHDFNNLLTAIMTEAELARMRGDLPSSERALEAILETARRAAELTRQLLAFSRRHVFRLRVVELNELVVSITRLLERLLPDRVELEIDLARGPLGVRVDPGQIEQILMNLVVNAGEALGGTGTVTVGTQRSVPDGDAGWVELTVEDDGPGMAADIAAQIFDPFFTTKGQGTGLGLATCREIALRSGGELSVSSQLGHGTRFTLRLPLESVERPVALPELQKPAAAVGDGRRVLLVDDDPLVLQSMELALEVLGYRVAVAQSRDEVDVAIGSASCAVAIVDVQMPGASLDSFLRRFAERHPATPVLLMSGDPEVELTDDTRAQIRAPMGFIAKPFNPAQLGAALRDLIDAA